MVAQSTWPANQQPHPEPRQAQPRPQHQPPQHQPPQHQPPQHQQWPQPAPHRDYPDGRNQQPRPSGQPAQPYPAQPYPAQRGPQPQRGPAQSPYGTGSPYPNPGAYPNQPGHGGQSGQVGSPEDPWQKPNQSSSDPGNAWGRGILGRDAEDGEGQSWSDRRRQAAQSRAHAREARWRGNRYAVPYYTDGPKVTLGVLWFAVLIGGMFVAPPVILMLLVAVAALAAAQTAYAFMPRTPSTWAVSALAAGLIALSGFFGGLALIGGTVIGVILVGAQSFMFPVRDRVAITGFEVGARAALPVGLAAGSLLALNHVGPGAVISLIALISAYEVADFLIGSGSSNAIEGPVSGVVALASVTFVLWTVAPAPFVPTTAILFGVLAAVSAPLGQLVASALLPRGSSWAPALRRFDSYLVAAPMWLLLLERAPITTTT